ncbi:MAG: hypothetical protein ACTHXX_12720 [Staphylococcus equorum]
MYKNSLKNFDKTVSEQIKDEYLQKEPRQDSYSKDTEINNKETKQKESGIIYLRKNDLFQKKKS